MTPRTMRSARIVVGPGAPETGLAAHLQRNIDQAVLEVLDPYLNPLRVARTRKTVYDVRSAKPAAVVNSNSHGGSTF